jgi:hypothetical protein
MLLLYRFVKSNPCARCAEEGNPASRLLIEQIIKRIAGCGGDLTEPQLRHTARLPIEVGLATALTIPD